MKLHWSRGDKLIHLNGVEVLLPAPLLWLNDLPDGRILVVTMFDEKTPTYQTNAFVFNREGVLEAEIKILENDGCVRFLASEVSGNEIFLAAANCFRYKLNPQNWAVIDRLYYR